MKRGLRGVRAVKTGSTSASQGLFKIYTTVGMELIHLYTSSKLGRDAQRLCSALAA